MIAWRPAAWPRGNSMTSLVGLAITALFLSYYAFPARRDTTENPSITSQSHVTYSHSELKT